MKKVLLMIVLLISLVDADRLKIDTSLTKLQKFSYENPDGEKLVIDDDIRTVIISFEKYTGKLVNQYLDSKHPLYLDKVSAVFIADISEMPSIITRMFALPKMRKYKHIIYLHYDEKFSKFMPHVDERVTVIKFKSKKVNKIFFISTKLELKSALEN